MDRSSSTQKGDVTYAADEEPGSRKHVVFTITMVVCVIALLLAPLGLLKTSFYIKHSNYLYDPVIDFKASLAGQNDDIVFYGDSSALHNVVPRVIDQSIHSQVYNLGTSAAVVAGAPDLILDRYLQRNKMPRVIVLYLAPTTSVNGYDLDKTHFYEAGMVLERYGSPLDALRFYADNLRRAFGISAVVFRNLLVPPELSENRYRTITESLAAQSGWTATPDIFHGAGLLADRPPETDRAVLTADAKYILDFKRKYEALGARVFVYVSPVGACSDLSTAEIKAAYASLADNEPDTFPCEKFRGGFHLTAEAAEENSERVAGFLRRELGTTSSAER